MKILPETLNAFFLEITFSLNIRIGEQDISVTAAQSG